MSSFSCHLDLDIPHQILSEKIMSKEHKNKRDQKKKSVMTPKEKKAAKKFKKDSKESTGLFGP